MFQNNYDKIISLDVDTITSARLDEFLDDDDTDILATLNYPNQDETEHWKTGAFELVDSDGNKHYDSANINAGVCCFNSLESLEAVIKLSLEHFTHFAEQGGLNEMAFVDKSYSVKIVDGPYPTSKVVYNARSKGVFGTGMNDENTPQSKWYVDGDKMFTHDGKHIKCFHYVEGFGGQTDDKFKELINNWNFNLFNEETREFYKNQCDCFKFFDEEYSF
jgi:lipopolysaccharide biosynthesis glycosyltransferase